jgi:NTE family protein
MTILILLSALATLVLLGATAAFAVAARRRVLAPFRSWVTARSVSFRCTVTRFLRRHPRVRVSLSRLGYPQRAATASRSDSKVRRHRMLKALIDRRTRLDVLGQGVKITLHDSAGSRKANWNDVGTLSWDRFALVLGAGGSTGAAFEAGVLLALATDFGVVLADADAVVGTSAGSLGAGLIGLGFEAHDLAAFITRTYDQLDSSLKQFGVASDDVVPALPNLLRLVRRPTGATTRQTLELLFRRKFVAATASAFRPGEFDLASRLPFFHDVAWPDRSGVALHLCATNALTGERKIFSESTGVKVLDVVAASCAIPSVMRPTVIDGVPYVDGAVVSPTNADVLASDDCLTIIVSPMSGRFSLTALGQASSSHARRQLGKEVHMLRKNRTVVVIEPSNALSATVLDDTIRSADISSIVTAAYLGATAGVFA